jgi:3-phosphoshikimate 1-carboxyvinyltransferase
MESITIKTGIRRLEGRVALPLSKSISNRALIISAISGKQAIPGPLSDAGDTRLMQELLRQAHAGSRVLHAENAGTVFRFICAYLSMLEGSRLLTGDSRMKQRPVRALVEALQKLGASISYAEQKGFPPLLIKGGPMKGGSLDIEAGISSQHISALMMIAPALPGGLCINLKGRAVSRPYIDMTAAMMKQAGIPLKTSRQAVSIPQSKYHKCRLKAEADWSSAAFWYECLALAGQGELLLEGLEKDSIQGDRHAKDLFVKLGIETNFVNEGALIRRSATCRSVIDEDFSNHPDLAIPFIVAAAALGLKGSFGGLEGLRHKESNRPELLAAELEKAGIRCRTGKGELSFDAQKMHISQSFETRNDHRMAMAFAPLALLGRPVTINRPDAVKKSYPGFWKELDILLQLC